MISPRVMPHLDQLILAVGAIFGVASLAVAVLVGDMGGSLPVTINSLRLAHLHPPDEDHGAHVKPGLA